MTVNPTSNNRSHSVRHPILMKLKRTSDIILLKKANSMSDCGSVDSLVNWWSKQKCFREHRSAHSVEYRTTQPKSHPCATMDDVSSPTTRALRPETLCLYHGSVKRVLNSMNHLLWWITSMIVPGHSYFLVKSKNLQQLNHKPVVAIVCLIDEWMEILGTLVVVEQAMEASDYLNIIVDQLLRFHNVFFLTTNGVFK